MGRPERSEILKPPVSAMKQYWRRPFHFWTDFKRAVEAKQVPEPGWYRFVDKNPPGIYNILGRRPWTKIEFPQDVYRKLYYKDYPLESLLYAHSALPGTLQGSRGSQRELLFFSNLFSFCSHRGIEAFLEYLLNCVNHPCVCDAQANRNTDKRRWISL